MVINCCSFAHHDQHSPDKDLWCGPLPVPVTTRIVTCSLGNLYKPSFATGILGGGHTQYRPPKSFEVHLGFTSSRFGVGVLIHHSISFSTSCLFVCVCLFGFGLVWFVIPLSYRVINGEIYRYTAPGKCMAGVNG